MLTYVFTYMYCVLPAETCPSIVDNSHYNAVSAIFERQQLSKDRQVWAGPFYSGMYVHVSVAHNKT